MSNISGSTSVFNIEKQSETTKSGKENAMQKAKNVACALETNRNVKSKAAFSDGTSNKIASNQIKINPEKSLKRGFTKETVCKNQCSEDSSDENEVKEAVEKDCGANSSVDSKNNSALNEGKILFIHYIF